MRHHHRLALALSLVPMFGTRTRSRPVRNSDGPGDGGTKTPTTPSNEKAPTFTEADVAAKSSAAVAAALKELGFEKLEDAKVATKAAREAEEAKKTELEKVNGKLAELSPRAKRAEVLEGTLKRYLETEEKAVPKEKRDLLDLAPSADQPEARLEWILNAKTKGLFGSTEQQKANTRAGGNPPPASGAQQKHPRDMNDAEFADYQRLWQATNGGR